MRVPVLFLIIAVAALVVGCDGGEDTVSLVPTPVDTGNGPTETPPGTPFGGVPLAEGETSALSVDVVPGEPVDVARTVSGNEPFEVDVVLTQVSSAYKGVQFKLAWDPAVLSYIDQTYHEPLQTGFCQLPLLDEGSVYGGCAGQIASEYVGPIVTVKLRCVGPGTGTLHLVALAEDPDFGTGVAFRPGLPFSATLADGSVTCEPGPAAEEGGSS